MVSVNTDAQKQMCTDERCRILKNCNRKEDGPPSERGPSVTDVMHNDQLHRRKLKGTQQPLSLHQAHSIYFQPY